MEKVQVLAQIWTYFTHNITISITDSWTSEGCGLSRFIVKILKTDLKKSNKNYGGTAEIFFKHFYTSI